MSYRQQRGYSGEGRQVGRPRPRKRSVSAGRERQRMNSKPQEPVRLVNIYDTEPGADERLYTDDEIVEAVREDSAPGEDLAYKMGLVDEPGGEV